MTRAVGTGRLEAVQLVIDLGVDVNDPARTQRITALHDAAASGRGDLVQLLLQAGADPNARDLEFDARPSGWADHQGHAELAQCLASLETDPS